METRLRAPRCLASNDSDLRPTPCLPAAQCLPLPLKQHMYTWRQRITNNRYFYHYLFWAIVLLSYVVDTATLLHFNAPMFYRALVLKNGVLIGIVYFHLRVLIPRFLTQKRYWAYAGLVCLTIVVGTLAIHHIEWRSWQGISPSAAQLPQNPEDGHHAPRHAMDDNSGGGTMHHGRLPLDALTVCRYLVISLLLKFIDDFFRQRDQLHKIQQEKSLAELHVLKAQVNPHFLFNTLNNLYGLVLERSDLAAETVLKLSDIMKYNLAEGNADTVLLKKDLENLRNYFELECLRLSDLAEVRFSMEGVFENQRITPLLLLPLVENAFKYGVHQQRDKQMLRVEIKIVGQDLYVRILNQKPSTMAPNTSLGLGIQNVRKRLDLLYPDRYRFETEEDHRTFRVTLHLRLA